MATSQAEWAADAAGGASVGRAMGGLSALLARRRCVRCPDGRRLVESFCCARLLARRRRDAVYFCCRPPRHSRRIWSLKPPTRAAPAAVRVGAAEASPRGRKYAIGVAARRRRIATRGSGGLHQLVLEPSPLCAHAPQTTSTRPGTKESRRGPLILPAPPRFLPRL
jgi:hypothetical protein